MIVSETPRLVLRRFTPDDADALAVIHADPVVAEFIGGVVTPEQTRARVAGFLDDYARWGFSKWAVVLKSTCELIGRCGPVLELMALSQPLLLVSNRFTQFMTRPVHQVERLGPALDRAGLHAAGS